MSLMRRLPLGLLAALALRLASGVLVGVDLGSQFFKAVIVSPGKPFDIVPNQHSKRKTPTVVSFHEKVRTFGDDALASAARALPKTPMFFMSELGRNLTQASTDNLHWLPKRFYPYGLRVNSSGSLQFQFGEEGEGVTVEEATAHILSFVKKLSQLAADGIAVSEVVLTVPSEATFVQRRALLAAAEIARLPRVQLVHETSAAALLRAPDLILGSNGSANTSTVLYYNMGARHVEACIVAYRDATHMSKPTVALDVLGCGSSSEFGGHHVDMLIAEEMRNAFGTKNPKLADGLGTSVRALKKLEKEANALKHVLSANKEAQFRVEALFEDTDFFKAVSREALESLCAPLFKEATAPIEVALRAANVTLEDVDTVEMIGGGWRMPKVQSLLSEYLRSHRSQDSPIVTLSQHLNGDEAMAMGAAFFGANSSISFRTKKIFFTDVMRHSYGMVLSPLNASQLNATEAGWSRDIDLFAGFSKLRAKKTVKLHVGFDLAMTLLENGNPVATWELSGIHEAASTKYANLSTPLISLKIELDGSGVVRLTSSQAIFDEHYTVTTVVTPPPPAVNASADANTSSTEAAGSNSSTPAADKEGDESPKADEEQGDDAPKPEEADAAEAPATEAPANEAEANTSEGANASDANATNATTITKNKIRKLKVQLNVLEQFDGMTPRPLSPEEIAWARERLDAMNKVDDDAKAAEAAKNNLEAFIYESREKVMQDEWCLKVSTEGEREAISSMLTQTEDWLYEDEATNGNASTFDAKRDTLMEKVGPIRSRAFELEQRPLLPEIVEKIRIGVNETLIFVKQNMTWVAAKEIEGVANLTAKFEDWYANITNLQSERPLTETPVYTVRDVHLFLEQIRSEAVRLTKIKKIDPMPYSSDYGRYGGYGGYDEKMREYYKHMYDNMSRNGTNFSDMYRGGNYSNFSGWNDSDYMRSFYEHAARDADKNFSSEEAKSDDTKSDAPKEESQQKAEGDHQEL